MVILKIEIECKWAVFSILEDQEDISAYHLHGETTDEDVRDDLRWVVKEITGIH